MFSYQPTHRDPSFRQLKERRSKGMIRGSEAILEHSKGHLCQYPNSRKSARSKLLDPGSLIVRLRLTPPSAAERPRQRPSWPAQREHLVH
eukprot:4052308-Pyramimonas_sp.AAC.1